MQTTLFTKPRKHSANEGSGAGLGHASASLKLIETIRAFRNLNTREARVGFAERWLAVAAGHFEETWPIVYEMLDLVKTEGLYQGKFENFQAYFEKRVKKPFAIWAELEQTYHFVRDCAPELIEKAWPEARQALAERNREADAKDQANQRPAGRPKNVGNENDVTNNFTGRPANTVAYALRRLRKDRPDIHARVLAGEITAHAGMIEAGFRKKRERKQLTALDKVRRLLPKLTPAELDELAAEIEVRRAQRRTAAA